MLKSALIILISTICFYANAQFDHNLILVKYKDGVTFLGEKLSEEDNIIEIKLKSRDLLENTIRIDRRTAFRVYDKQNALVFENGKFNKITGLFGTFSYGIGFSNSPDVQVNTSINRFMNNKFALGIGVGIQSVNFNTNGLFFNVNFASLYGSGRYYLTHKRRRLYTAGTVGYGYGFPGGFSNEGSNAQGGLAAALGAGISFASSRDSKYFVEILNYFQKGSGLHISTDQFDNEVRAEYDLWFKRIAVRVGIDF